MLPGILIQKAWNLSSYEQIVGCQNPSLAPLHITSPSWRTLRPGEDRKPDIRGYFKTGQRSGPRTRVSIPLCGRFCKHFFVRDTRVEPVQISTCDARILKAPLLGGRRFVRCRHSMALRKPVSMLRPLAGRDKAVQGRPPVPGSPGARKRHSLGALAAASAVLARPGLLRAKSQLSPWLLALPPSEPHRDLRYSYLLR